MSKNVKKSPSSCTVAVIYEFHDNALPTQLITRALPMMKQIGFTIFLCEEPSDRTMKQTKEIFTNHLAFLEQKQEYCAATRSCTSEQEEAILLSTPLASATVKLFQEIKAQRVHYQNIDLSTQARSKCDALGVERCYAKRDDNFVKKIENVCQKHDKVIFLVGYGHHEVVLKLANKGYNVKGFAPLYDLETIREYAALNEQHSIPAVPKSQQDLTQLSISTIIKNGVTFSALDCEREGTKCEPDFIGLLKNMTQSHLPGSSIPNQDEL